MQIAAKLYFASTVAKTMIKHTVYSQKSVTNLMPSNAFDQEVGDSHMLLFLMLKLVYTD
jgi:hypothetical protein